MIAITFCELGKEIAVAMDRHLIACCALAAAYMIAAQPAFAANELQPGLWQDTKTGEANGKPLPPKVTTSCVTPEDSKDPVKMLQAEMKKDTQQCNKLDVKQNGNVIIFDMKCGDPKEGAIDMTMTYTVHSPQHSSSVGKTTMTIMGQKMTSTLITDGKWIAAKCK
jgi:hypothetical protein